MRIKTATLLTAAAALSLAAGSASAVTSTITGTTGGADSFNDASNWDNGLPGATSAGDDAIISAGIVAQVNSTPVNTYSGGLNIGAGSSLRFNTSATTAAVSAAGSGTITMQAGATIDTSTAANLVFNNNIVLAGDGFFISNNNAADRDTKTLAGVISGSGDLTITGRNVEKWVVSGSNTYSGDTFLNANDRYIVRANATNAFAGLNLTVTGRNSDNRSAVVDINAVNAINPLASVVFVNANGGNNTNGNDDFSGNVIVLNVDADQTLAALTVNGAVIGPGSYTGGDFTWLGGSGTLTIVPEPSSLALLGLGGLLIARRRRS